MFPRMGIWQATFLLSGIGLFGKENGLKRYCDTIAAIPHIVRYLLRDVSTDPKWCDTPLVVLRLTQAHLCDAPFCNISCHDFAMPLKTSMKKSAILSLQVLSDVKSVGARRVLQAVRLIAIATCDSNRGLQVTFTI